jgi:hypothetical protein
MKGWKRILFYLLLNVLVTACTITGIFLLLERTGQLMPGITISNLIEYYTSPPQVQANPVASQEIESPQPSPTPVFLEHEVQQGETLAGIAEEYSVSLNELLFLNDLDDSADLSGISMLLIPEKPSGSVVIDRVIGAGDIETERVLLRHRGEGNVVLVGWTLEDGKGNVYTFPAAPELTLYKNGAVDVYTRPGNNSVIEMYWGRSEPVWLSGTMIELKDTQGNTWDIFTVP